MDCIRRFDARSSSAMSVSIERSTFRIATLSELALSELDSRQLLVRLSTE
jgi:hypothetical protein